MSKTEFLPNRDRYLPQIRAQKIIVIFYILEYAIRLISGTNFVFLFHFSACIKQNLFSFLISKCFNVYVTKNISSLFILYVRGDLCLIFVIGARLIEINRVFEVFCIIGWYHTGNDFHFIARNKQFNADITGMLMKTIFSPSREM